MRPCRVSLSKSIRYLKSGRGAPLPDVKIDLQICRKIDVGGINGAVVDGSRRNALQIDGAEAWETRAKGLFRGGFKTLLKWVPYGKAEEVDKGSGAVHEANHRSQPGVGSRSGLRSGAFKGAGDWTSSGCCPANSPVGLEPLTALCAADAGSAAGSTLSAAGVGAVTEASVLRASAVFGGHF